MVSIYNKHPCFKEIEPESIIWRYTTFEQFADLLLRGKIFFSRLDHFEDPYEGTIPKQLEEKMDVKLRSRFISFRKSVYVNCWHINQYESDAMWKIYGDAKKGIVIKTTYSNLCKAFNLNKHQIYIGKINYNNILEFEKNILNVALWKRPAFRHENELRAVYEFKKIPRRIRNLDGSYRYLDLRGFNVSKQDRSQYGVYINVDLNPLIQEVYVAPFSPLWFKETVQLLLNKALPNRIVEQSPLYKVSK